MNKELAIKLTECLSDCFKNNYHIVHKKTENNVGETLYLKETKASLQSALDNIITIDEMILLLQAGATFRRGTFADWMLIKLMDFSLTENKDNQKLLNRVLNLTWLDTLSAMSRVNYSASSLIKIMENTEVDIFSHVSSQNQGIYVTGLERICGFVQRECVTTRQYEALKVYLLKRENVLDVEHAQRLANTIHHLFPAHLELFSDLACIKEFLEAQNNNTVWEEVEKSLNIKLNLKNLSYQYLIDGYTLDNYKEVLTSIGSGFLQTNLGVTDIIINHKEDSRAYLNTHLSFILDNSCTLSQKEICSLVENSFKLIYDNKYHALISLNSSERIEHMDDMIRDYLLKYEFNQKLEKELPENEYEPAIRKNKI